MHSIKGRIKQAGYTLLFLVLLLSRDQGVWAGISQAGVARWGAITGLLSTQTDLQTALNAKVAIPSAQPQVIVIYGSSTAAGTGATTYAQSWAGLLTASLSSFTFFNESIAGNNTADLIARFYTDVVPRNPNFVILASSVFNESFAGAPVTAYNTFVSNQGKLVRMIQQIGAVPIIAGQIANDNYTEDGCKILQDIYDEQQGLGVPLFDFLSVTKDPASDTCEFYSGASSDGIHPNDAYHAALYSTIPQGMFNYTQSLRVQPTDTQPRTYTYGTDTSNTPLSFTFSPTLSSWTVGAWVKDATEGSKAFMAWTGSTGPLRVRNAGGMDMDLYDIVATGVAITSDVNGVMAMWKYLTVTYHYPSNTISFYINGELVGASTGGTQFHASGLSILGRADNTVFNCVSCMMAEPVIYMSSLDASDVKSLFAGRYPAKSLLYYGSGVAAAKYFLYNGTPTGQVGVIFTGTNGFITQTFFSPSQFIRLNF